MLAKIENSNVFLFVEIIFQKKDFEEPKTFCFQNVGKTYAISEGCSIVSTPCFINGFVSVMYMAMLVFKNKPG